ncbi:hypothetical protein DM01DRAFT_1281015 [Hesseltinella vesiculosa]|uniref:Uncharacterized protein n=1 Tax=Hesseltinella vesiculosa TaxID=101127 RepID=A0A1X2GTS1_9FUNG|nr:hypothetical protein DM01DRAFT_1281015 [Hesseltinella vesiculosa]
MSISEVYSKVIVITNLFDDKSVRSFSTWCGMSKLDFFSAEIQRKYQRNELQKKTNYRLLWVLKKVHRVVGYVRKSPGKENKSKRLQLLNLMVDRMVDESTVDMVFASYSSKAKEPIINRDKINGANVPRTSGNTQDMLQILSNTSKPVAIHF